jgi:hypothetical protein
MNIEIQCSLSMNLKKHQECFPFGKMKKHKSTHSVLEPNVGGEGYDLPERGLTSEAQLLPEKFQ